jgi:hypothetical protein
VIRHAPGVGRAALAVFFPKVEIRQATPKQTFAQRNQFALYQQTVTVRRKLADTITPGLALADQLRQAMLDLDDVK